MMKKLELPVAPEHVEPLFNKLDKNGTGYIEYDEFKYFIFFDAFTSWFLNHIIPYILAIFL